MSLTVDEFTGRGLEKIRDSPELMWSLNTLIAAIPKTVPKEKVLVMFDEAWQFCGRD